MGGAGEGGIPVLDIGASAGRLKALSEICFVSTSRASRGTGRWRSGASFL